MAENLSYLMGAEQISDAEVTMLGIEIKETTNSGSRMLVISDEVLPGYFELIKTKLASGFWNEVVGEQEITFIFKFKDGSVREYKLSPDNEKEVNDLCIEFNNEPPDLAPNVYRYLSDNKFYYHFMVEHYADLINRQMGRT